MTEIRFGTSGWRGVIADDFTFERARIVVAAIAEHLRETGDGRRGVVVGYDPRFLAEEFARSAADQLAENGIRVLLTDRPTPTPAISFLLLARGLGGAVNFTASHNPPVYQGLKFSSAWGGPALPQTTGRIEELAADYIRDGLPSTGPSGARVEEIDPVPEYLEALGRIVNFEKIAASGLPILYDALFGAGAGFLDRALKEAGCGVEVLHCSRDPLFGGGAPDPSEERLADLSALAFGKKALGLSTDGDADRFGVVDHEGVFYQPNSILALLAEYLLGARKTDGDLARSVATTGLLDEIAKTYGRECHETPVGFKYIGEMISKGILAMGGEESAGMSIRGHVPEKDGILACLLTAEMVAVSGKTLPALMEDLADRYGPRYSIRLNLKLDAGLAGRLRSILSSPPESVGGHRATRIQAIDGVKWIFSDKEWALIRLSGTEPIARLYIESDRRDRLEELEEGFRRWITSG